MVARWMKHGIRWLTPISVLMAALVSAALGMMALTGCSTTAMSDPSRASGEAMYENPMMIRFHDPLVLWETLADVMDDYFTIQFEFPLREQEGIVTAGELRTFPQPAATLFEPWRKDSANFDERLRSTVQSLRRYATVTVTPVQGGFLIELAVIKEIEDVRDDSKTLTTISSANVNGRSTSDTQKREEFVGEAAVHEGWIPLERDRILEQRILGHLTQRLGVGPTLRGTAIPGVITPGADSPGGVAPPLDGSGSTPLFPGPISSAPPLGGSGDPYTPTPAASTAPLPPPPPGTGMPPSGFTS